MSAPRILMDVLTTVPTLWDHIRAAVEVGTSWLLMDALVKVRCCYYD